MESSQQAAKRFEWAVRALAQPPGIQLALFPDFTSKADELALDFEEWLEQFAKCPSGMSLTSDQKKSLGSLDNQLEAMSGPSNDRLWTEEALVVSDQWGRVRQLALEFLDVMGWATTAPPTDRSIYVGPPEDKD